MKRRDFLKIGGFSAMAAGGLSIIGSCRTDDGQKPGQMTYRSNPKGEKVSLLGYGCMRWPMREDEEGNETVDQEMTDTLVDYALKHGVNYFDAAPMYHNGECEKITGIALSRHPRESYFIATKLSNFKDHSREASMKMYEQSFKDLRTDYIDYYLLHSIGSEAAFNKRFLDNGMMDFLMEERKKGRIRNLGFSFHGKKEGFDELMALHDKYHWDFVQIQLNYVDWTHASSRSTNADYLMEQLHKKGIPAIIMEPLLGGKLAKLPAHLSRRLKERDPKQSLASWAFRFAGSHDGVLCVLSGMTYMEHLQDNIKTFSPLKVMDRKEFMFMEDTAELLKNYPTIDCTQCNYCGCPYGLDIPLIFTHYNKCVNEGYIAGSIESSDYRKARRAYLVSYNRAVPKQLQADHCIGCGQCMEDCPQEINIPHEMRRIDRYIEALKKGSF